MRSALILPLLLALSGCLTSGRAGTVPVPVSPVQAALQASVWPLRDSEGTPYCTAFSIAPHVWMSAKHCEPQGEGETVGQLQLAATAVYSDPVWDLCIIKSSALAPPLELGVEPSTGDIVSSGGYGHRGPISGLVLRSGRLLFSNLGTPVWSQWPVNSVVDIPTVNGDSGSPVVDKRGKLVGVVWGYSENNKVTWVVPYEAVAAVYTSSLSR